MGVLTHRLFNAAKTVGEYTHPTNCLIMNSKREFIVEPIGLELETLSKPVNWQEMFGNDHPVELEIGSGKGTFLCDQAKARPEVNLFGIEWARQYWRLASDRLRRNNCLNVRMVRAEASFFLTEYVPSESLSVLHIYFPDPWPKARHHKRRLIQPKFVPLVNRVLKPGGRWQVVTDHKGYFEEDIEPTIRNSGFEIVDYNRPGSAADGEFVGTA